MRQVLEAVNGCHVWVDLTEKQVADALDATTIYYCPACSEDAGDDIQVYHTESDVDEENWDKFVARLTEQETESLPIVVQLWKEVGGGVIKVTHKSKDL